MTQFWNEKDIIEYNGQKYLNKEMSKKLIEKLSGVIPSDEISSWNFKYFPLNVALKILSVLDKLSMEDEVQLVSFQSELSADKVEILKKLSDNELKLLEKLYPSIKNKVMIDYIEFLNINRKLLGKKEKKNGFNKSDYKKFLDIAKELFGDEMKYGDIEKKHIDTYFDIQIYMTLNNDVKKYFDNNVTIDNLLAALSGLNSLKIKNIDFKLHDLLSYFSSKRIYLEDSTKLAKILISIECNQDKYYLGTEIIKYFKSNYNYEEAIKGMLNGQPISSFIIENPLVDEYVDIYGKNFRFMEAFELATQENDLSVDEVENFIIELTNIYSTDLKESEKEYLKHYKYYKSSSLIDLISEDANSFDDVLKMLKDIKILKVNEEDIDIDIMDDIFICKKFYDDDDRAKLEQEFYKEILKNKNKYAYSDKILDYYTDLINEQKEEKRKNRANVLIEKIEDTLYDEESFDYKIINRIMPKADEDKKKVVLAAIAGIGVISFLLMTFVLGQNPISCIITCAATLKNLIASKATFGLLGAKIFNTTLYFASIYETLKVIKKTFFKEKEEEIFVR